MLKNVHSQFGPALVFLATVAIFLGAVAIVFAGVPDAHMTCAAQYSC